MIEHVEGQIIGFGGSRGLDIATAYIVTQSSA